MPSPKQHRLLTTLLAIVVLTQGKRAFEASFEPALEAHRSARAKRPAQSTESSRSTTEKNPLRAPTVPGSRIVVCRPVRGGQKAAPAECAKLVEPYLAQRLEVWQGRLKLTGWKISIKMATAGELKPRTLGNVHWTVSPNTALIRVLDASEYELPCCEMLYDMEQTVVHELIHLKLSGLTRSDATRDAEETAVSQITDAMLSLDRRN